VCDAVCVAVCVAVCAAVCVAVCVAVCAMYFLFLCSYVKYVLMFLCDVCDVH